MTVRYLLDTNTVSDLVRNTRGQVAAMIARVGEENVCTSIIVAAELRYGSAKKGSVRLTRQLEEILQSLEVLGFEQPADSDYGAIRAELERRGHPIGGNDYLIAAHALASGCVLVTANEREFTRVEGLKVENWLREA